MWIIMKTDDSDVWSFVAATKWKDEAYNIESRERARETGTEYVKLFYCNW
jgi:hypothetical protein